RLIPGGVQRIAGATGDHNVHGCRHRDLDDLLDEADARFPGLDHVAGPHPGDAALAIEADIDDEITASHQGAAGILLVHVIDLDDAAVGPGMLQELRPVPD